MNFKKSNGLTSILGFSYVQCVAQCPIAAHGHFFSVVKIHPLVMQFYVSPKDGSSTELPMPLVVDF